MRNSSGSSKLCFRDLRQLIQLRHADLTCDHLLLENASQSLIVQYTCPGRGFGRTHILRESAQLIQMETQGVADGLPFEFAAEGRRVGECGG